jgi:hypothetical protein
MVCVERVLAHKTAVYFDQRICGFSTKLHHNHNKTRLIARPRLLDSCARIFLKKLLRALGSVPLTTAKHNLGGGLYGYTYTS